MIRKNKKFIDPRYFMNEKMELNERILDFEALINTTQEQLESNTVTKETLAQLISALQQSQDPEQVKTLKILKNRVHHAIPETKPYGVERGTRSPYTKAEKEMMQRWDDEYPNDVPPGFPSRPVADWYADYIQTGRLK